MEEFLGRMKSLLGGEYDEFLKYYEAEHFRGLRVNTLKCTPEKLRSLIGFELKPTPFCPNGFYIPAEVQSLGNSPLHHCGAFYIQEPSATSAAEMLGVEEGDFVLDLCAAPGGKSTQIGAMLNGTGLLWSNEIVRNRANILLSNIERMGIPNAVVSNAHPDRLCEQLAGRFDKVLVDAPCSGEGMFRKDPRAREEWSPAVVELCAARQKRILADVWPALREGGLLIYSTCTYEAAENDENLAWAAAQLGGEILEPEAEFGECGVRLTPHGQLLEAGVVPGEGQWAGALRKTAPQPATKNVSPELLHPLRSGLRKGETKGKDFIPDPDYALSIKFDSKDYPAVDVDRQTALRFLHRDALVLPQAAPGYNVITYLGHPLGFVKNIGSRCNNLLPKGRRILMNV